MNREQGLYPLKFLPLFKNKIWGGNKIRDILNVDYSPLPNCGELWTLSGLEGNESVISNGYLEECTLPEAIEMYADELVGQENYDRFSEDFPLLLKIIDANDNLSVQVHPDDKFAQKEGMPNGKNEMWYVLHADENARIYDGFNKKITKAEVINRLNDKTLMQVLHEEKTNRGDVFFIPAGRIHAIGKGVLLAEIQQSSDLTYRIYDWDRSFTNLTSRPLNIEQALQVMDLSGLNGSAKTSFHYHLNETNNILNTPFFTTNHIHLTQPLKKDYTGLNTFVLLFCIGGSAVVHSMGKKVTLKAAEVVMLPAVCTQTVIEPKSMVEILEIFII